VQTKTLQVRVLDPQTAKDAREENGYVGWHRGHSSDEEWRFLGQPLNTKALVCLTDVGTDDGCTACVPAGTCLKMGQNIPYTRVWAGEYQKT